MNKGRDYYRALQAHCKQLRTRRRYPQPIQVHQEDIPGRPKAEFVTLGGRHYRRDNIENKVWVHPYALDAEGKPVTIPYQTCTLVRVQAEKSKTGETV